MPNGQEVKLDFSKAQPIQASEGVILDFSKAEPLAKIPKKYLPGRGFGMDVATGMGLDAEAIAAAEEQGGQFGGAKEIGRQVVSGAGRFLASVAMDPFNVLQPLHGMASSVEQAVKERSPGQLFGAAATIIGGAKATEKGAAFAGKAAKILPSTERAGKAFSEVKAAAGNVPIEMGKAGNTALELYTQSQRGGTLPKAVRDFVNRATKPESKPITYAEAKDFQSNISRLSVAERMRLTPNVHRLVGQLAADLRESLRGAADTVGKGEQFIKAMKEYRNAMRLKGYSEAAMKNAWKLALTGIGLYELKKFFDVGQ